MGDRLERRRERRRTDLLALARERGEPDTRAMWLLPYAQRRPHREHPLFKGHWNNDLPDLGWRHLSMSQGIQIEVRHPFGGFTYRHQMKWQVPYTFFRRCRPSSEWFPPIFQDRLSALCDLYVASYEKPDASWGADLRMRLPAEPEPDAPEPMLEPRERAGLASDEPWAAEVVEAVHVAADEDDLRRWQQAAIAYLTEIDEVVRQLGDAWTEYGHRIAPSPRRTPRRFARWQAALTDGYDRLLRASEQYRPIHDEVRAQAEQTARTYPRISAHFAGLFTWQQRKLWYLAPAGTDEFRITRSDVAAPAETATSVSRLKDVIEEARDKRLDLHLVDWDEDSVRLADRELADMAARLPPPSGTTPAGRPMVPEFPQSFLAMVDDWFGPVVERLRNREELERERAQRAQWRAERAADKSRRTSGYHGGSYPTDPGGGDYGGGDFGSFGGFGVHT
ncbi:hypothetical protein GCM10022214_84250 [Actinomadura miaoliensis]|uniref:PE-PGRS family protein n=2 Tax=Actinomadura miaoliensis TaxID=430685 RepID=A0ABP7X575_9ACTN